MRACIISAVFPPEPLTSAVTSADLAEEMVRRGHEAVVFAPFPNRPTGSVMSGYVRRWRQVEYRNHYKVVHSWHTLSRKSSILPRVIENISFGLTSTWQLMREKSFDVAYMNTWPVFSQNFNSWLLQRRGIPIVCSVQDIYPESLTGKGMLKVDGWSARIIRFADRCHLKRCAVVTSISPGMVRHLVANRMLSQEKVQLVPNWMDASAFTPSHPRNGAFRQRHGIGSDIFLAVFAGSLTRAAGVELYVQAAERLRHRNDICILLVGDGSMRSKLEQDIAYRKLKNIKIIYPLCAGDVPEVQAAADVLLLSLSGEMSLSAAPSKQIAYMLSGRPIVASISAENGAARILTENESGFVLPPDEPGPVADLLAKLPGDRVTLQRMGAAARQYAEKNFSKQVMLPRLADLLESVARGRN